LVVVTDYSRTKKIVWGGLLLFALVILVTKIGIVFVNESFGWALTITTGYVVLLYSLFVFEGLHHVAMQMHGADHDSVRRFIESNVPSNQQNKVRVIAARLRDNFNEFLIGRQIGILSVVVMLASVIDSMALTHDNLLSHTIASGFNSMSRWALPSAWGVHSLDIETARSGIRVLTESFAITLLLSALLPCWIAQMLPEMLADGHSIRFMRNPFVSIYVSIAIRVARIGAGWPGRYAFLQLHRLLGFIETEHIEVGDAALFEKSSSTLGLAVTDRSIKIIIKKDGSLIEDKSRISYFGSANRDVGQVIRVAVPNSKEVKLTNAHGRVPSGIGARGEWNLKWIKIDARDLKTEASLSLNETVMSLHTTLKTGIPRSGKKEEAVYTDFAFEVDPFAVVETIKDSIYFDISKPTKRLTIEIEVAPGLFVLEPVVLRTQPIDELLLLGVNRFRDVPLRRFTFEQLGNGSKIEMGFPPLASRFQLELDVRNDATVTLPRDTADTPQEP